MESLAYFDKTREKTSKGHRFIEVAIVLDQSYWKRHNSIIEAQQTSLDLRTQVESNGPTIGLSREHSYSVKAKTKRRPQVASRIPSRIQVSQSPNQEREHVASWRKVP